MNTLPTEFACVIRLVNCYLAIHVNKREKAFISKHPETDIKVARAAAQSFAESHNIVYKSTLQDPDRPIITVLEHQGKWFPAEIHADRIALLAKLGPLDLGGSQQEAINMANAIALSKDSDSIPSIGISLSKSSST